MNDDTRPGEARQRDFAAALLDAYVPGSGATAGDIATALLAHPLVQPYLAADTRPTVPPGDDLAALVSLDNGIAEAGRLGLADVTVTLAAAEAILAALRVSPGDGDGLREAVIDAARRLYERLSRSAGGMMQDDIEALGDALDALDPEAGD